MSTDWSTGFIIVTDIRLREGGEGGREGGERGREREGERENQRGWIIIIILHKCHSYSTCNVQFVKIK